MVEHSLVSVLAEIMTVADITLLILNITITSTVHYMQGCACNFPFSGKRGCYTDSQIHTGILKMVLMMTSLYYRVLEKLILAH
jgi:hypothetical protein